jgi:hypothetical protein
MNHKDLVVQYIDIMLLITSFLSIIRFGIVQKLTVKTLKLASSFVIVTLILFVLYLQFLHQTVASRASSVLENLRN